MENKQWIVVLTISIHAPHARSDNNEQRFDSKELFQSTLLMRGATKQRITKALIAGISIHAPHARSDNPELMAASHHVNFNPRSSCEERHLQ